MFNMLGLGEAFAAALPAIMSMTAASATDETCAPAFLAEEECFLIVASERLPMANAGQSYTIIQPQHEVALRVDSMLSNVPGLSLFRRADSLSAHPTTQGLSMRGVGANGAGRVLVTVDGVPLNDPFGGWIYWSALNEQTISQINVMKGGTAGAFGPQALAGAVEISLKKPVKTGVRASASYGSFDTLDLSAGADLVGKRGYLSLSAGTFESDGFYLLEESERGSVDVPAASEASLASLRGAYHLGLDTSLYVVAHWFEEERVNGFSLALNETEALDTSVRLKHEPADGANYELLAWYRTRDFANVFASARDERTTERAVLDQFDVPGWGAGLLARVQYDALEVGVDTRRMSGETNERFRNLGAGFTRQRLAGGDQWTIGAYSEFEHEADWGSTSVTARLDHWRTYNGVRNEYNIENGFPGFASPDRADVIDDRDGLQFSGRLGGDYKVTDAIKLRGAAYKSWRLPTINEYYRPFRVVNDITEANSALVPEKLYGLEVGVDYQPINTLKLSLTVYRNWLKDGVGNVTIGFGPGFFPLGGFVPAGGVLRQRTNIDESITDGVELDAEANLSDGIYLFARYAYARARITEFSAQPDLIGNRPVQTPKHTGVAGFRYEGWDRLTAGAEVRFSSSQYDDDTNLRKLDSIVTVNASGAYKLTENISVMASVENLFDAKVISAVTANGRETLAKRRLARVGLKAAF